MQTGQLIFCVQCGIKPKVGLKFCGHPCYWKYRSENKMYPPSQKGKSHTQEWKDRMSKKMKEIMPRGENSRFWKGSNIAYSTVHIWLLNNFKKEFCELCGIKDKRMEWANISGEYKRDRFDFLSLCKSCHFKFDDVGRKMWVTRRANVHN